MGNVSEELICCIGLYDVDLNKLSHHLHSSIDYVEAITDIAEFILTRMTSSYIPRQKHSGKLSYYYKAATIRRVIICHNNHKIVSYHFPFEAAKNNNSFLLSINGIEINLEKLAKTKEIIEYFRNRPKACWGNDLPVTLIDAYRDMSNDESDVIEDDIFKLFYLISTTEPGYLRYDFDPDHEKGKIHPCNHIDINFNNHSTYKYGLYKKFSFEEFENIFNKYEEKLFLHAYRNDINNQLTSSNMRRRTKKKNRKHPFKSKKRKTS